MTVQLAEIYYQRGDHYHQDGLYDEAIEDFDKVLEFVKNGGVEKSFWLAGGIFRMLANTHRRRDYPGDRETALEYLNEGIRFLSE